jgi:hypothetical protein
MGQQSHTELSRHLAPPPLVVKSIAVYHTSTTCVEYNSLYFYGHLDEDDKYPVFIDGNHALTEIINNNAKGGTAVVIKDSFSHSIAPFLAENYKKLILVDLRYFKNSVSDLVKNENPDQLLCIYGIDNLATDTDLAWLQ